MSDKKNVSAPAGKFVPVHAEHSAPDRKPHSGKCAGKGRAARWTAFLFLPVSYIVLEAMLRLTLKMSLFHDGFPAACLAAVFFAFLGGLICSVFRSEKAAGWVSFAFLEIMTIWFLVAYFTQDSYKVFMGPEIIMNEAGNVAKNFGSNVLNVFVNGFRYILLFHIPAVLFLIFRHRMCFAGKKRSFRALVCLCIMLYSLLGGYYLSTHTRALREQYFDEYTYDNAVKNFGLLSALIQDIKSAVTPDSVNSGLSFSGTSPVVSLPSPSPASDTEEKAEKEESVKYEPNVMDIDFENSNPSGDPSIDELNAYVQSLSPSLKNKYTGIFEGKNLILITAEAFSKEVIDPVRTPALYRMANKGIVFEDFYQPAWGGSTSTGEFSFVTGLAPTSATAMTDTCNNNLYFTMGNQLQRLGYHSCAYHNGTYEYYGRNFTHRNLGYSDFIAIGNGLEQGLTIGFPQSDLEMFDYTVPQYIDKEPFSIYYMTISGHASYMFDDEVNDMSVKNEAITEDMPYSEPVRAYYACNQELEYGMESLIRQLDDAGILDNTVIALVADHYPYGLQNSAAWGITEDCLAELYGHPADTPPQRDHNQAIIWCSSLEELDEPVKVSGPTSSLDLLPTLQNLFGLEYDSRLLPGRDALSDTPALVFWNDHCWLSDLGFYDSHERCFYPADGAEVTEEYVEDMSRIVKDKLYFSTMVMNTDYYRHLFGYDDVQ